MSPGSRARWLQRIAPVAVSLGVLLWLLHGVDLRAVVAALNARVAAVMIPALLLFCAATLGLEAVSIHRLVRRPASLGIASAARIKCASYLPGLVHYSLGFGALAVLLRRRAGLSLGEAVGLVLLISSTDLLVALSGASASAAMLGASEHGVRTGIAWLLVGGALAGLVLLRAAPSLGPFERIRSLKVFEGMRRLPLARLTELLALRVLFSACFVAGCASAFEAFEIRPAPAHLIGGTLLVALIGALPIAVAGIGTSQAAFVYLFADVAPAERLLAMSLVLSFGIIGLRGAIGLCFARDLTRETFRPTRIGA